MASASLQHEHAWTIAASVVEIFAPLIRDEEKVIAFHEVYERVRQELQKYEECVDRMRRRLGND